MYGDFAGMYDPLMKDVDYDSWAEYLLRFLGAEKLRVTDCACGTGEITLRLARAGHETVARMRARVLAGLTTTFASTYKRRVSLEEMLTRDAALEYRAMRTGEKYLVTP